MLQNGMLQDRFRPARAERTIALSIRLAIANGRRAGQSSNSDQGSGIACPRPFHVWSGRMALLPLAIAPFGINGCADPPWRAGSRYCRQDSSLRSEIA